MRHNFATFSLAIFVAFVAGVIASPLAQHAISEVHAESAPLTPMMIDLSAIKHGDLPSTTNPELNARGLVITDNATIGIQSGNIAKHIHPKTDEIQYIIEGVGEEG